jgi:hypothetical protein
VNYHVAVQCNGITRPGEIGRDDAVFKRERASPTQLITVESVSLIAEFIARGYGTSIQPRHAARPLTVRHDIALRELASP